MSSAKSEAIGIFVVTQSGAISNTGSIAVSANTLGTGIFVGGRGSVGGGIANSGTINVSAANNIVERGIEVSEGGTIIGAISNGGTITATGSGAKGFVDGIAIGGNSTITGGIANGGRDQRQRANFTRGIELDNGTVIGGIGNAGSPGGVAIGISLGLTVLGVGGAAETATISGGVTNSGTHHGHRRQERHRHLGERQIRRSRAASPIRARSPARPPRSASRAKRASRTR